MIVDGYVRVSQVNDREGERFISPVVQREAIEGWARLHGALVGEVLEELDESGGRRDRPLLERAIARVERGESAGIVVWRLDRFGRSLLDGLAAIDRITRAGGTFVAVEDGLDLSTDSGRLVLRIMLSLAEWELDRVRSSWRVAKQRAIARGVHIGPAPAGYSRRKDGRLVPNPAYAPLITMLFQSRADGARIGELCRLLNERGLPTLAGAPEWTWTTVDGLLRNRTYLGEVRHGTYVNTSAHAPLVDPATWQAAQRPLETRPARRSVGEALLRGLLRCSGCCRMLTSYRIRTGTGRENRMYGCAGRSVATRCRAPVFIQDSVVEPYLEAVFWQELERWPRHPSARRLRALEAKAKQLESELLAYRDSEKVARTLHIESFERGLEVRSRRHERALLALAAARRELADHGLPDPGELRSHWPALRLHERRHAIGKLIDCAFVLPSPGAADKRLVVCARGQAPDELPPSGPRRNRSLRPFDPAECRGRVRLAASAARRWPEEQVWAALEPFLADRTTWPTFPEFQAAGLGLVHRQVELFGGEARWARRHALRREPLSDRWSAWSTDRIRRELEEFLAGRPDWPTQDEFKAAGRATLERALYGFGGHGRWADELGLELPNHRRRRNSWTDERIEQELLRLTAGTDRWPTKRAFEEANLVSLYHSIMRRGLRTLWAKRLGLRVPRGPVTSPLRWSDQAIDGALGELLEGRETWPSWSEFAAADLGGLYQAITKSHGGHERWARRYGLPRPTRRRAQAARAAHARRRAKAQLAE